MRDPKLDKVVKDAETEEITGDSVARILNVAMAKARVDSAELPRLAALSNAVGKMTKIFAERSIAYRQGHITPTHENFPFMIPKNAKADVKNKNK